MSTLKGESTLDLVPPVRALSRAVPRVSTRLASTASPQTHSPWVYKTSAMTPPSAPLETTKDQMTATRNSDTRLEPPRLDVKGRLGR